MALQLRPRHVAPLPGPLSRPAQLVVALAVLKRKWENLAWQNREKLGEPADSTTSSGFVPLPNGDFPHVEKAMAPWLYPGAMECHGASASALCSIQFFSCRKTATSAASLPAIVGASNFKGDVPSLWLKTPKFDENLGTKISKIDWMIHDDSPSKFNQTISLPC